MRNFACLVIFIFINLISPFPIAAQKQLAKSPSILSAKTVYFDNRTGDDSVGTAAVAQLKKWGRFQVVHNKQAADLILLLSADPYHGGHIIFASGQSGSIDAGGHIQEDVIPTYDSTAVQIS